MPNFTLHSFCTALAVAATAAASAMPSSRPVAIGDRSFDPNFQFVRVEPGEFLMGSPEGEPGRYPDEKQRRIRITRPFEVATTEVTQSLWKRVLGNLPKDIHRFGDSIAVTYVSWESAQQFLAKLNEYRKGDGYLYRLPTEAEWEYMARGGHIGGTLPTEATVNDYAWNWNTSKEGAKPVALLKPNALGVYDTLGNVWEWTADTYVADASSVPESMRYGHPVAMADSGLRVIRSGCWARGPRYMRPAMRGRLPQDAGFGNLGLRIVREKKSGS